MKEAFIEKRFSLDRIRLIVRSNQIIDQYLAEGYRLTLRQLFYQMVTQNILPNTERSYKLLGATVSDGRLAGHIDWDAIEDRVRVPIQPPQFADLNDLVDVALRSYRLPRWLDQDTYVELWVEKDALAGVLRPLAMKYHVLLMVNRGYSSQSAMYEAAQRFKDVESADKKPVLLYLGDHDPSGEDMVRDIRDRMERFGVNDLTVEKIALTMAQVRRYKPPPNPAKMSDSRARDYVLKHGSSSWEVDALRPDVLHVMIERVIAGYLDMDKWEAVLAHEAEDKADLARIVKELKA